MIIQQISNICCSSCWCCGNYPYQKTQHQTGNWGKYKNTSLQNPSMMGIGWEKTFLDYILQAHPSDLERMWCTGAWDLGTPLTEKSGGDSSLQKTFSYMAREGSRMPHHLLVPHSSQFLLYWHVQRWQPSFLVYTMVGREGPGLAVWCLWMHYHPHKGGQGQCSESWTTSGGPEWRVKWHLTHLLSWKSEKGGQNLLPTSVEIGCGP